MGTTRRDPITLRVEKLKSHLRRLSGKQYVAVSRRDELANDGSKTTIIRTLIRVRRTELYFAIMEEFRQAEREPSLHQFAYRLQTNPSEDAPSLFRYELHPEFDDPVEDRTLTRVSVPDHYARHPHFHPDQVTGWDLRQLHYPFRRGERNRVIFALIYWLETDLVSRFHE